MCLGIPGQVIAVSDAESMMAKVDIAGVQRDVNVMCVLEPGEPIERCVGRWVLVHVGFAMSVLDEQEAQKTLSLLQELGEMEDELAAIHRSEVQP